MTTMGFEVSGGPTLLSGTITHAALHEITDPVNPTTIIRIDQDWMIHLRWKLDGSLVSMIGGDWLIQAYLESAGAGFEGELTTTNPDGGKLPLDPTTTEYDYQFRVAARVVDKGSYKLVAHISYNKPDGNPGPLAGFYEVPLVRFYDPGPPAP